jgi:hypothetical protein
MKGKVLIAIPIAALILLAVVVFSPGTDRSLMTVRIIGPRTNSIVDGNKILNLWKVAATNSSRSALEWSLTLEYETNSTPKAREQLPQTPATADSIRSNLAVLVGGHTGNTDVLVFDYFPPAYNSVHYPQADLPPGPMSNPWLYAEVLPGWQYRAIAQYRVKPVGLAGRVKVLSERIPLLNRVLPERPWKYATSDWYQVKRELDTNKQTSSAVPPQQNSAP